METDLGYNEGEFLCLMLGDAETSWTNVVSAPLISPAFSTY